MRIREVMVIALLAAGCAAAGAKSKSSDLKQGATESWFVGHRNSRLASYHRIRTRSLLYEGRATLHTVTDAFLLAKHGGAFVLRTRIEEWTEPDGRLIRLRARMRGEMAVEVEVRPQELVYKIKRGSEEIEHTRTKVPKGMPVYASFHSFLSSSRFKAAGFRPGLKHDFLEANPFGRNPLPHTLEPMDQEKHIGIGAFEFMTHKGIHVSVTRNLEIQRITYSRTASVFATSKPDVKLKGDDLPTRVEIDTIENAKEDNNSNKELKATR